MRVKNSVAEIVFSEICTTCTNEHKRLLLDLLLLVIMTDELGVIQL